MFVTVRERLCKVGNFLCNVSFWHLKGSTCLGGLKGVGWLFKVIFHSGQFISLIIDRHLGLYLGESSGDHP